MSYNNQVIRINELNTEELKLFACKKEAQLLHYYEPELGVFIAESEMIISRAFAKGLKAMSFLVDESVLGNFESLYNQFPDAPIYTAPGEVLNDLTEFNLNRGICALMRRQAPLSLSEVCKDKTRIAILENVTNPTNVGAIFRNAAALGIDGIVLTHGSADPYYRRSGRVSMGTVFMIPWCITGKNEDYIGELKELGFSIASMALTDRCVDINNKEVKASEKLAIAFGNEANGLKNDTLENSDFIIKIPMSLGVDSLNVAASSAIAFWELGNN